jgi:hypothetical protein
MTNRRPPPTRLAARAGLALAAGTALAGCILVPAQVETWDATCGTVARHLELQAVQVAAIDRCAGSGCQAIVVAAAATAAASAIVSGSVVVVGNVAYWLERQATCGRPPAPSPPAPAADAPST